MARHRAPDVASPLHGVHPTGTVGGRPRHAAGPPTTARIHGPERRGRHRGPASPDDSPAAPHRGSDRAEPALQFVGPIIVTEPEPRPVVVLPPPAPEPAAPPVPEAAPTPPPARHAAGYPMTETVLWASFAALVSCGVVAAGQGPREEAIWILGIGGASLGVLGLGLVGVRRRRHGRA